MVPTSVKQFLRSSRTGRVLLIPYRIHFAFSYLYPRWKVLRWAFRSREIDNFTYDLKEQNKEYLAAFIASITHVPLPTVQKYFLELENDTAPIDLFISDSDHDPNYEMREYEAVEKKLTPEAFLLADNAHCSDRLLRFARKTHRQFLFFHEEPKNHWYPGAGIGVAYRDLPT